MHEPSVSHLDRRLAAPMFWLAALFLLLAGVALHLADEDPDAPIPETARIVTAQASRVCVWGLVLLYPLFLVEGVWHWRSGGNNLRQHVWETLFPPLRLGGRDHVRGRHAWLPRIGWTHVDDELRKRVERGASLPMLAVALLVLPLLAAEYFLARQVQQSTGLLLFARAAESLIWTAFAFEFIVMISLAERKWRYARQHWIDLLIICLPLVAFLRMARLGRLLRLGQLGRMQQALRALRLFRIRVTALRVWRALLLLEVADRVVRATPDRKLARLREEASARERELQALRAEIAELESRIAADVPDAVSEPAA